MAWERSELGAALEALLFASDAPVSISSLCDVLPRADEDQVKSCIQELKDVYASDHGGLQVVKVAGGYHIRTRPEVSHWVERLLRKRRKMRLSQAALETLAIVAYRQPVTKMEMESIRGVDVGGVLGTLLERSLITIKGRSKGPGRPLLYATTKEFLDHFGLNGLEALRSLGELGSLLAERDEAAVEDVPTVEPVAEPEPRAVAAVEDIPARVGSAGGAGGPSAPTAEGGEGRESEETDESEARTSRPRGGGGCVREGRGVGGGRGGGDGARLVGGWARAFGRRRAGGSLG